MGGPCGRGQAEAPCFVSTPAQVRSHLHNVVTILHLERNVLHSIAVFDQVIAHLCGRQGRQVRLESLPLPCTLSLLGSISFWAQAPSLNPNPPLCPWPPPTIPRLHSLTSWTLQGPLTFVPGVEGRGEDEHNLRCRGEGGFGWWVRWTCGGVPPALLPAHQQDTPGGALGPPPPCQAGLFFFFGYAMWHMGS